MTAPVKVAKGGKSGPKDAGSTSDVVTVDNARQIDSDAEKSPSEGANGPDLWSDVASRASDVPDHCRKLYRRAMTGKSRRAAIRAHCLMCVGYAPSEVRRCTATACPLYPYRLKG